MHHFFVTPEDIHGDQVSLSSEQAHQVARVLRLRAGAHVCVLDGSGDELECVLEEVSPSRVTARVQERRCCASEPRVFLSLGLGLLKGEKMDWAIQKATEAGASEITPALCERSIVRVDESRGAGKAGRWQRIAQEAAEQCRRGRIPQVIPPQPFAKLLERAGEFDRVLLAHEAETRPLAHALQGDISRVLLLIGPEGGFSPEEVQRAREHGAIPVSLGARVLRAETAAVVGTAMVLYQLEQQSHTGH